MWLQITSLTYSLSHHSLYGVFEEQKLSSLLKEHKVFNFKVEHFPLKGCVDI